MTGSPMVSILMACYNTETFVGQAIESVLNESFIDFELLICDDGSTDNSFSIIQRYAKQDDRIRVFQNQENAGRLSRVISFLASKARGKYLLVSDSDDLNHYRRMETLVAFAEKNPQFPLVFSKNQSTDEFLNHDHCSGYRFSYFDYFRSNYISNGVFVMKRDAYNAIGGIDTSIIWAEDNEFRLRLARLGPFFFLDTHFPTYTYRLHHKGCTGKFTDLEEISNFKQQLFSDDSVSLENIDVSNLDPYLCCQLMYSLSKFSDFTKRSFRKIHFSLKKYNFYNEAYFIECLSRLGLRSGGTFLVQTGWEFMLNRVSLNRFFTGLQKTVGPNSLLLTPLFTYQTHRYTIYPDWESDHTLFSLPSRPKGVFKHFGSVFMESDAVSRNFHPAFSFGFLGKNSETLAKQYDFSLDLSDQSPLGLLLEEEAEILLFGTRLSECVALFMAEYLADVPFSSYQQILDYIDPYSGKKSSGAFSVFGHSEYYKIDRLLELNVLPIDSFEIAGATCYRIPAKQFVELIAWILRHNPVEFLCRGNDPECLSCAERLGMTQHFYSAGTSESK